WVIVPSIVIGDALGARNVRGRSFMRGPEPSAGHRRRVRDGADPIPAAIRYGCGARSTGPDTAWDRRSAAFGHEDLGQLVGDHLDRLLIRLRERILRARVDVDLSEDLIAGPDEDNQLRLGLRAAREIIVDLRDVAHVLVLLLGDGR